MPVTTPSLIFDFAGIELDRSLGLSRQLYQALRQRILDGRLGSGTRLPASRDLAVALSISRNSVMRAYDQLYAEGFTEGRIGDGTYVAQLADKSSAAKKYPQNYPQGYHQGYQQTCPQKRQICLIIYPVMLSTAHPWSCFSAIIWR